jgi:hypothetical protein
MRFVFLSVFSAFSVVETIHEITTENTGNTEWSEFFRGSLAEAGSLAELFRQNASARARAMPQ